jgi:dienelactone hydrolase
MKRLALTVLAAIGLLCAIAVPFAATAQDLDASLGETIISVPKKGLFTVDLETTVFKAEGDGPFPLVVISHGKAMGDPRFQNRYRPTIAARYFLERGYIVVVPMRQGFSKSGGSYIGGGCNVESNGLVQATDLKAVLDYFTSLPYVDKSQILLVGQSHGGWTTLATGTLNYPGVKGLVNFAGGLKQETCPGWEGTLARAAGSYGKSTSVPSLWFYGDNDSYFSPLTWKSMHEQYTGNGGKARMVAFGPFASDSHTLFGARRGVPIWQPELEKFLVEVALPSSRVSAFAKYGRVDVMPAPPKTDFAAIDDAGKIPYVRDTGRVGYEKFLLQPMPRAFALAPNGSWGWAEGGDDPLKRALGNCNARGQGQCRLYAVDADVVWKAE